MSLSNVLVNDTKAQFKDVYCNTLTCESANIQSANFDVAHEVVSQNFASPSSIPAAGAIQFIYTNSPGIDALPNPNGQNFTFTFTSNVFPAKMPIVNVQNSTPYELACSIVSFSTNQLVVRVSNVGNLSIVAGETYTFTILLL